MPPPSSVRQPIAARRLEQLRLQREIDDLDDPLRDAQQVGWQRQPGILRHAGRGRVHQTIGLRPSPARRSLTRAICREGNSALSVATSACILAVIDVVDIEALRAELEHRVADRRASAARAELHDVSGRRRRASPRLKLSAKPHQSVLCPTRRPSENTTVFTAPSALASSLSASSSGRMVCLHG